MSADRAAGCQTLSAEGRRSFPFPPSLPPRTRHQADEYKLSTIEQGSSHWREVGSTRPRLLRTARETVWDAMAHLPSFGRALVSSTGRLLDCVRVKGWPFGECRQCNRNQLAKAGDDQSYRGPTETRWLALVIFVVRIGRYAAGREMKIMANKVEVDHARRQRSVAGASWRACQWSGRSAGLIGSAQ